MKQGFLRLIVEAWLPIKRSRDSRGFNLVEAVLASAVFALLVSAFSGAVITSQEGAAAAGARARANFLAEEGLEATRYLRDASFANLTDGAHGLALVNNQWVFSGASDLTGIFTRQIQISSLAPDTKEIIVTVTWQQNPARSGSAALASRLTNWRKIQLAADHLVIETNNARLDPSDQTKVIDINLSNQGDFEMTLDKMTLSWSGAPGGTKLNTILINNSVVFNGNRNSGQETDLINTGLAAGATKALILDFSRNLTGVTLTLTVTLSDGSSKTVAGIIL